VRARLIAVLCAVAATAVAAVALARPGRAVRVPRSTAALSTAARFCALHEDDRGVCFVPVQLGDTGAVLTAEGENLGDTSILEITPNPNRCGLVESWSIRVDRSRLGGRTIDYGGTLAIGTRISAGGKLVTGGVTVPGDNPLASVLYALDSDGDGRADLLVDQFPCDDGRRPSRSPTPSHTCTEYWVAVREHWQRARVDQVAVCNR
jgi:hypothetical protein